jgi:hypothetical protein
MAKLKMVKLPKKPKRSASTVTKENYLKKVDEIKKENQRRKKENDYALTLDKKIAGISGVSVAPGKSSSGGGTRRKKKSGGTKKKAAKKTARKRKR